MGRAVLVLLAAILALALAGSVGAAPPDDGPDKGPPTFDKIVFVHYPKGHMARGGEPGPPGGGGGGGGGRNGGGGKLYKYRGIHWGGSDPTVTYVIEAGLPSTWYDGVEDAFSTWDAEASIDFVLSGVDGGNPSSFTGDGMNGANEVGWLPLTNYPGAIAVTSVWYNRATKLIAEVDMAMNEGAGFHWVQNTSDPGLVGLYDVQNIVTHEAGHWIMLGDLYTDAASEQTMYGYGSKGELKKRSLESGDIEGILAAYP